MAYLVLARKYRPLQFADMVGQEHVTRTLRNAIEHDRVHHAYLFSGARGLGKTTTARILAKALVCRHGPTPAPCDACTECVAVNKGASVDVVEIDGASNNRVDDVRSLREQVHYLPQSARRKVYIIDEVHMLTSSAFNALLKTLEEPPPHINFVFATTEPHKVLATILSRVSRLDFRRLSTEQLARHLAAIVEREQLDVESAGLLLVARAAGGSVRDAMTLLDQVLAFGQGGTISEQDVRQVLGLADSAAISQLLAGLLAADAGATLRAFDSIVGAGHDLVVLAGQVLQRIRDLLVVKLEPDPAGLLDAAESELVELRHQAALVEVSVLGQMFDRFARVVDLLPQSRTQRLTLEMGLLDLVTNPSLVAVTELVARLESIAGGGSGAPPTSQGGRPTGDASRSHRSTGTGRGASPTSELETSSYVGHGERVSTTDTDPAASSARTRTNPAVTGFGPWGGREEPSTAVEVPRPSTTPTGPISGRLWSIAKEQGLVDSPTSTTPAAEAATGTHGTNPEMGSADSPAGADGVALGPSTTAGPSPLIAWCELEPIVAWDRLVARIRERDEFLSAVLSEIGLAKLGDGRLRLAAAPGSFAHIQCNTRPELRASLEQALRDHFGVPLEVEIIDDEPRLPELPSLALVEADRRARRQEEAETAAREHRAIRRLVETFRATLGSVKPLDG